MTKQFNYFLSVHIVHMQVRIHLNLNAIFVFTLGRSHMNVIFVKRDLLNLTV